MASFGENLRRERELRGVSLREIADATKISVRFLQALEQDRLDVLPGGLFPRVFVRQYARHVGLDAERVVAEFLYVHGGERAERVAEPPAPVRRSVPLRVALAGLGGLALAALLLLLRSGPAEPPEPPAGPAVAPVAVPVDRVYPPPGAAATDDPATAVEGLVLTLNARQTCWVKVTADGQTVLDEVLEQGQSKTLEAEGELVLSVGNAGGLSFTVNDRPGLSLGRSGEVRRNIVITRDSWPSLVEDAPVQARSHSG